MPVCEYMCGFYAVLSASMLVCVCVHRCVSNYIEMIPKIDYYFDDALLFCR